MKSTISSCFNDKRFVLNVGIHTLAYFHKDLKSRFPQMVINKKGFSQIRRIQKDSHKKKTFLQMITNKSKCVEINSPQLG